MSDHPAAPAALAASEYLEQVAELLFDQFLDVIRVHEPEIEPLLRGAALDPAASPELLARTIQAQGMWFQLLSIAEQNAAMRQRRQAELERGPEQLRGTFAQVVSAAATQGVSADEMRSFAARLRVRPVITAHPTEAKRVTVLEKHRRIYRRLVDLEAPRWTPRERNALIASVRAEIELLWLTGELRLEKPTVAQERAWGLHFVTENLFDVVPELVDKLDRAVRQAYPGAPFELPPFFQLGSWIGGDRDGNPFVTNEVTHQTVCDNRVASLRRYRQRLAELLQALSPTERAAPISVVFRQALSGQLEQSGAGDEIVARNPGEVFRQYVACLLRRLDATLSCAEQGNGAPAAGGYRTADELIARLQAERARTVGKRKIYEYHLDESPLPKQSVCCVDDHTA